jgi:hypothetical protein
MLRFAAHPSLICCLSLRCSYFIAKNHAKKTRKTVAKRKVELFAAAMARRDADWDEIGDRQCNLKSNRGYYWRAPVRFHGSRSLSGGTSRQRVKSYKHNIPLRVVQALQANIAEWTLRTSRGKLEMRWRRDDSFTIVAYLAHEGQKVVRMDDIEIEAQMVPADSGISSQKLDNNKGPHAERMMPWCTDVGADGWRAVSNYADAFQLLLITCQAVPCIVS